MAYEPRGDGERGGGGGGGGGQDGGFVKVRGRRELFKFVICLFDLWFIVFMHCVLCFVFHLGIVLLLCLVAAVNSFKLWIHIVSRFPKASTMSTRGFYCLSIISHSHNASQCLLISMNDEIRICLHITLLLDLYFASSSSSASTISL